MAKAQPPAYRFFDEAGGQRTACRNRTGLENVSRRDIYCFFGQRKHGRKDPLHYGAEQAQGREEGTAPRPQAALNVRAGTAPPASQVCDDHGPDWQVQNDSSGPGSFLIARQNQANSARSRPGARHQLSKPGILVQRIPLRVESEKWHRALALVQASGEILDCPIYVAQRKVHSCERA